MFQVGVEVAKDVPHRVLAHWPIGVVRHGSGETVRTNATQGSTHGMRMAAARASYVRSLNSWDA